MTSMVLNDLKDYICIYELVDYKKLKSNKKKRKTGKLDLLSKNRTLNVNVSQIGK